MIRRTTRETETLLAAREKLGLSQHQVASLVGLADRQYQRYEYGEMAIHRINLRAGLALCAVLEIDPVSLVFDGNKNALKVTASSECPRFNPLYLRPDNHFLQAGVL